MADDDFVWAPEEPKAVPDQPDISGLRPAVAEDGRALFGVGDKIVIQRLVPRETLTYRVTSLDLATGNMWLYDEMNEQSAGGNFKTGPATGDIIKMAPPRGFIASRRRRGFKKPKKEAAPKPVIAKPIVVKLKKDGTPSKRRGRPPGSKNKPKS